MKLWLYLWGLFLVVSSSLYGQNDHIPRIPRNLKQAVRFLDKDCPDSLKSIIKITPDDDLYQLSYPWKGHYKTIYNWTSDDNENSRIVSYLDSRGVHYQHIAIVLQAFKLHLLGFRLNEDSLLKPFRDIESQWTAENKVKYTADSISGIYIPIDLDDCIRQINIFWPDSIKQQMKILTEDEFSARLHLGFGMWMRNNWQLWGGSRLSRYFNQREIYNAEDMSGIILDSYHRVLNGTPIKLDEQIKFYKDYWRKSQENEILTQQKELSEYKIGDTLIYKYGWGYADKKQEDLYTSDECIAKGIVVAQDSQRFYIKVRLITACSSKGIISYDNKNYKEYNTLTGRWERIKKRILKYLKKNQEDWFKCKYWDKNY